MKILAAMLLVAFASRAEILDRIAVTVNDIVITERDTTNQLRIAAFLNQQPLVLDGAAKREAAERLVEQTLVRREMEISRYPVPTLEDAEPLLEEVRSTQFESEEAFENSLSEYGLNLEELREGLRLQLTIVRFIDFRFRPGITVTDEEVERYYNEELVPESRRRGEPVGTLDEVRDTIEEVLISERVNSELDEWLQHSLESARVVYREEAFQ